MLNFRRLNSSIRITIGAVLLSFFSIQGSTAQEILQLTQEEGIKVKKLERKGNRYFKTHDTGKGSGYKLYQRALYWAKRNADDKGRVYTDKHIVQQVEGFQSPAPTSNGRVAAANDGWQELGPFNWSRTTSWNPGLGRIVAIDVERQAQKIIFAGSPGGGIWKSVDAGQSWRPVGDDLSNMTIWSVAIDPTDVNTVYIGNSAGQILKSTNGGNSWSVIKSVSGTPRRILIHPNGNTIFVGTTRALYRSTNAGGSFSTVNNSASEDVEFMPGNTNVVYACGDYFFRSTNGGASFSRVSSGIVSSERMKMAVTPANANYIYIVQASGSSFGRLYRSTNGGQSFSVVADNNSVSTNQVYFTQAWRDMAIAVSDSNEDEVHLAGMDYSRSTNGGRSFTKLATWSSPGGKSYIHADVEFMRFINGVIYYGTDGGIYRSTNNGSNTSDLTQGGLAVRQYYRIGGSKTDANRIVGGAQDNGTNIMHGTSRNFKEWLGADGMECFIDHVNKNVIYGTTQNGSLYKSTDGGNSIGNISRPSGSGEWVTPFAMDPVDNNTIYVGYQSLHRSRNGGSSWSNITSSINIGGSLDEIAIAPSNNNYIYIANEGSMWRTKNGQSSSPSWTRIDNFSGDVNYIAVDPTNPERVAIATTGSRVYLSVNAGSSWSNIRGNLPNISALCLAFDDTSENGLYVGMSAGVYYTNDNRNDWVKYATNLPNVQTTELEIHFPSRKIRLATYGRGIWEADLYGGDTDTGITLNAPNRLVAAVTDQSVKLDWDDNSNNEDNFVLERSLNGEAYTVIATLNANTETYTDAGLNPGSYTYRLRAKKDNTYSDYSNSADAVIEGQVEDEIGAPSGLTASVSSKNVTLNWVDNSSIEKGYTIQRSDNGGDFTRIDFISQSNAVTYTDENLENGTYIYRVRAYDETRYSGFSNEVEVVVAVSDNNGNVVDNCNGCEVYSVNSEETGSAQQGKENLVDGNTSTIWHSNWYDDNSSHPHNFKIDLGQTRELEGFSYTARQDDSKTGMVKGYTLYGWDGNEWQALSSGNLQDTRLKQSVKFNKFSTRYIAFQTSSAIDGRRWASAAEFSVHYKDVAGVAPTTASSSNNRPLVDLEELEGLSIYPVPFQDQLTIKGVDTKKVSKSIELFDVNGKTHRVKSQFGEGKVILNTANLQSGIYILRFTVNGQVKTMKVYKR
ncbi:discoidin domain-containing protein [Flammeovirga sp. SJP92]|uniref:discoidin domain-containing protein n=1 Tax=Flammeovirga sp. SJP92 TaxID=1775430 RepID=UPI0007882BF9|nr:discoidin domain-containing protein [Flammeovirga sp. SJP92]KXX67008.1 hypothetical protein AVL50_28970 [Flammeovirga sp. SJP92]